MDFAAFALLGVITPVPIDLKHRYQLRSLVLYGCCHSHDKCAVEISPFYNFFSLVCEIVLFVEVCWGSKIDIGGCKVLVGFVSVYFRESDYISIRLEDLFYVQFIFDLFFSLSLAPLFSGLDELLNFVLHSIFCKGK